MKSLGDLDATPEKRSYWAIVNDYDFNTALCELVDNPLDVAIKQGFKRRLRVSITADVPNQYLKIDDNSGGIDHKDLVLLVRPGASGGLESDQSIGIFGVGSKRSVIALAKQIKITTCTSDDVAYRVEYGDDWLKSSSWELPFYSIPTRNVGHTTVALTDPRQPITEAKVISLKRHLAETYGRYIGERKIELIVNHEIIQPALFSSWSFHPDYSPTEATGKIETPDGVIQFSIIGGLLTDSEYSSGDYGVFFYCNDRLIEKSVRTPEVGFRKGGAGVPHHSHSAFRAIVSINGPARWMPWNSSKSRINSSHDTFLELRDLISSVTTNYASLSKRLQPQWTDEIFPRVDGNIKS